MADVERESIIWCPRCREIKGEVQRVPTEREGVYVHRTIPNPLPKTCNCGAPLERRR